MRQVGPDERELLAVRLEHVLDLDLERLPQAHIDRQRTELAENA